MAAKQRVEDDEARNEDPKGKRTLVPRRPCSCCQEHDKRQWQSVINSKPRKSVPNKRQKKTLDVGTELFPGLSDHITLQHIATKLSWQDLHVLRCVSPKWQLAIQSREVYESRVHFQSTQTLVVVGHSQFAPGVYRELSLYSPVDDTWSKLPRNQYLREGALPERQCVSLDGKLYLLGGIKQHSRECGKDVRVGSSKVYVLDLAGQKNWQKCADMHDARLKFCCGVMDGKIYVFGGTSRERPVLGCEVYDPKVNAWSRIKPMVCSRFGHGLVSAGKEFLLHGGEIYDDTTGLDKPLFETKAAKSFEIYDPLNDEWTSIKPVEVPNQTSTERRILTSSGKLYLMTKFGINVYDYDKKEWTNAQSFCAAERFGWAFSPFYTIRVQDELLALVDYRRGGIPHWVHGFMRSKGFGDKKKIVSWEICGPPPTNLGYVETMWSIQM